MQRQTDETEFGLSEEDSSLVMNCLGQKLGEEVVNQLLGILAMETVSLKLDLQQDFQLLIL